MKTFRVFVEIINKVTQERVEQFTVEIDRTSDMYLEQLSDVRSRVNTDDLLRVTDCEYVLGLIKQPKGCYVITGC